MATAVRNGGVHEGHEVVERTRRGPLPLDAPAVRALVTELVEATTLANRLQSAARLKPNSRYRAWR